MRHILTITTIIIIIITIIITIIIITIAPAARYGRLRYHVAGGT